MGFGWYSEKSRHGTRVRIACFFVFWGDVYDGGWMANDPSDRGNEIEQNVCIDKCSGKDLSVRNVKNAQMFEAGLISKNGLTPHPLLTYNLI
ncbi:hypothetical protein D3Z47_14270 [Lachnospiraceae bacterium]|nr:hypothetical protein [Lachnospiraceae bacterium]